MATKISDQYMNELIKLVAGSDVIPLVDILKARDNVSEFKLAEKLKITVNQVRNMLYRLAQNNLVNSTRKKDKKKGWYIYYWTFDHRKAILLLRKIKQEKLAQLKKNLKNMQDTNHFICKDCKLRYTYTHGLDLGFLCTNCAKPMQAEDPNAGIKIANKEISRLEADLANKELEEPVIIVVEEPVKKPKKKEVKKEKPKQDEVKKKLKKKKAKKPVKTAIKKKTKKIAKKELKKIQIHNKNNKPIAKPKPAEKRSFVRRLFSRR